MSRSPQPPSQKNRLLAVAAWMFVLLLGLTGALGHAPRAFAGDTQDLRVGECFDTDDDLKDYEAEGGTEAASVTVVPCSEPHEAEVFAVIPLPDGPYPGDKKIVVIADEKCTGKALTDYVGKSAKLPKTLQIYHYTPQASNWALGNRDITCFLGDTSGSSTGSFRATTP
ncbi:septum formation family protein [Streptomyces sp. LARHCF249]